MIDLSAIYEVVTFAVGDTKAGTKMGKLQLKNTNDDTVINCVLWEETLNRLDVKLFRTGNTLKIINGTYNEKYNNCLITDIELVKEAKTGLSPEESEKLFSEIVSYANKINKSDLKDFVVTLLNKYSAEFKTAPAAKLMHHNYVGGLVEHTYECLKISENVISIMPHKLDTDIVFAACILHDFGKIFEYKIDVETGLIEYNEDFQKDWISHSQWGFSVCMTKGYKEIAKMIAAHHGRIEWGAIIDLNQKDLEPFVYFIHHIDDLSAKFGKISINDLN